MNFFFNLGVGENPFYPFSWIIICQCANLKSMWISEKCLISVRILSNELHYYHASLKRNPSLFYLEYYSLARVIANSNFFVFLSWTLTTQRAGKFKCNLATYYLAAIAVMTLIALCCFEISQLLILLCILTLSMSQLIVQHGYLNILR